MATAQASVLARFIAAPHAGAVLFWAYLLTAKQDTVKTSNRILDTLWLFWAFLLTVKRDTEENCNQISWKLRS